MGLISKIFSWGSNPLSDDSTIYDWAGGLVIVIILAFLWSTVIGMIE